MTSRSGLPPRTFFSSSGSRSHHSGSSSSTSSSSSDDSSRHRSSTLSSIVAVSSPELSKIFDAINNISKEVRDSRKAIEHLGRSQEAIASQVRSMKDEIKGMNERMDDCIDTGSSYDEGRLPPEISNDVHLVHNSLEDRQFKPEESLLTPHNNSVRRYIINQVAEKEDYPIKYIQRATVRYYETKRKLYLQSLPENRERTEKGKEDNKIRSRRKRLYKARNKAASGPDKADLEGLTYDYVSDEEDGVGDNAGKWVIRPPSWRSARANALMARIHQAMNIRSSDHPRQPRVQGTHSTRSLQRKIVQWAVAGQEREGHEREERQRSSGSRPAGDESGASEAMGNDQEDNEGADIDEESDNEHVVDRSRSPSLVRESTPRQRRSRSPSPDLSPIPPRMRHKSKRRLSSPEAEQRSAKTK